MSFNTNIPSFPKALASPPLYDRKALPSPKAQYLVVPRGEPILECLKSFDSSDDPPFASLPSLDPDRGHVLQAKHEKLVSSLSWEVEKLSASAIQSMERWEKLESGVTFLKKQLEASRVLPSHTVEELKSRKKYVEHLVEEARFRVITKTIQKTQAELHTAGPIFHGLIPETSFFTNREKIVPLTINCMMRTVIAEQHENLNSAQMKAVIAIANNSSLLRQELERRSACVEAHNNLLEARYTEEPLEGLLGALESAKKKVAETWGKIVEPYPSLKTLLPRAQNISPIPSIPITTKRSDIWALDLLQIFANKAPDLPITALYEAWDAELPKSEERAYLFPLRKFFSRRLAAFIKTVYENREKNDVTHAELGLTHKDIETILRAFSYFGVSQNPESLSSAIDFHFFMHPDWAFSRNIFVSSTLHKAWKDISKHLISLQHIDPYALRGAFAISSEKIPDDQIPLSKNKRGYYLSHHEDVLALMRASGKTFSPEDSKDLHHLEQAILDAANALYKQSKCCQALLDSLSEEGDSEKEQESSVAAFRIFRNLAQEAENTILTFRTTLQKVLNK
jgi:hypothetical protein